MTKARRSRKQEPRFESVLDSIRRTGSEAEKPIRELTFAVQYLESSLDLIFAELLKSRNSGELRYLAVAMSSACRALFQGHRTLAALKGNIDPMQAAIEELRVLDFDED